MAITQHFGAPDKDRARRSQHPFIEPLTEDHIAHIFGISADKDGHQTIRLNMFDDLSTFDSMRALERVVLSRMVSQSMRLRGDGSALPMEMAKQKLRTTIDLPASFRYLAHPRAFDGVWRPILAEHPAFAEADGTVEGWRVVGTFQGDEICICEVAPPDMLIGVMRPETSLCQPAYGKTAGLGVRGYIPVQDQICCETLAFIIEQAA
jgi:hypothetical protein